MKIKSIELRQSDDHMVDFFFEDEDGQWRKVEHILTGRISIHFLSEEKLMKAEKVDKD